MDNDIVNLEDIIMNPEYLRTVSHQTHNAIHYGDESLLICDTITERPRAESLTHFQKIV